MLTSKANFHSYVGVGDERQKRQKDKMTKKTIFIAPKASAEGACIFIEFGYSGACMIGYYDCA